MQKIIFSIVLVFVMLLPTGMSWAQLTSGSSEPTAIASGANSVEEYVQKVIQVAFDNLVMQIVLGQVQVAQLGISQEEGMQIVYQVEGHIFEHPSIQSALVNAYRKAISEVQINQRKGVSPGSMQEIIQQAVGESYRDAGIEGLIQDVAQHFIQQLAGIKNEMMMDQTLQAQSQQMAIMGQEQPQEKSTPRNKSTFTHPSDNSRSFKIP